ncbi:MAG TPA: hypothetical protein VN256_11760 [Pyrinomonadaceae bacterium]|nr:hypothetical protein [Pyrinomonadaceae bacterium]
METQRNELLDQLAKHGWEAEPVERAELEWWADEMWLLVSQWSPVGSTAYLTFMVNPLYDLPDRKKGQYVWAAMATSEKPVWRPPGEDDFTLNLNQGWKERMPELLEHLSRLRGRRKAEGIDGV